MENTTQAPAYDKASLLAMFQPKIVEKPVEGLGNLRLLELSAPEVSDIRETCQTKESKGDFGFKLAIASLVDEAGVPVFTKEDLPTLRTSAQARIGALVEAVMDINGFKVSKAAAEEAAKN